MLSFAFFQCLLLFLLLLRLALWRLFAWAWLEAEQAQNDAGLVESLVRLEQELDYQEERIVQAAHIPQTIEQAVSLSCCRFGDVERHEVSICECVCQLGVFAEVSGITIVFQFSRQHVEVVCLFWLPVLNKVSLILDWVHLDLDVLPISLVCATVESLRLNSRLFF